MTDERADLMLEILKGLQNDLAAVGRDQVAQRIRLHAIEDHQRGILTSLYGMQSDVADLKIGIDRIERRLGLTDTEH